MTGQEAMERVPRKGYENRLVNHTNEYAGDMVNIFERKGWTIIEDGIVINRDGETAALMEIADNCKWFVSEQSYENDKLVALNCKLVKERELYEQLFKTLMEHNEYEMEDLFLAFGEMVSTAVESLGDTVYKGIKEYLLELSGKRNKKNPHLESRLIKPEGEPVKNINQEDDGVQL